MRGWGALTDVFCFGGCSGRRCVISTSAGCPGRSAGRGANAGQLATPGTRRRRDWRYSRRVSSAELLKQSAHDHRPPVGLRERLRRAAPSAWLITSEKEVADRLAKLTRRRVGAPGAPFTAAAGVLRRASSPSGSGWRSNRGAPGRLQEVVVRYRFYSPEPLARKPRFATPSAGWRGARSCAMLGSRTRWRRPHESVA